MKVLAERFDLPKDLHPDELATQIKEDEGAPKGSPEPEAPPEAQESEAPEAPESVNPEEPQAPPPGPQTESAPQGGDVQQMMEQISQMPPDQALAALREIFADQPELLQMLEQIEALPPEQQSEAIGQLLEAASANV